MARMNPFHNNTKKDLKTQTQTQKQLVDPRDDYLVCQKIVPRKLVPGVCPDISLFSTITIYGKRKSGKSVWIKWFLQEFKHEFPWAWVFTKTQFNSFYASFIPEKFIISNFNADVLQKVMDRQMAARILSEKTFEDKIRQGRQPVNPRALVIWDDYSGSDIKYNKKLEEYYYTGRHYQTMNFFGGQHVTLTPPAIRSNTDLVVIFNTDYYDSLEHYWKDFAGKMDKYEFASMFFESVEDQHHFIAIDNNPNTPYEQKFFTGIAKELPAELQYICCCKEAWKDNKKQLIEIASGDMQKRMEFAQLLAKHHRPDESDRVKVRDKINPYEFLKPAGEFEIDGQ